MGTVAAVRARSYRCAATEDLCHPGDGTLREGERPLRLLVSDATGNQRRAAGAVLPPHAATVYAPAETCLAPAQVTEAGRMLATLHDAMAAYPHHIDGGPSARHEQLVHNDFRSANLLHDGTSITAILDFEEVTYRSRVSDLAKATVLLGTRFHNWGPTSQLVREAFVEAYCDQAPLTNAEQNQLQSGIDAVMKGFGWA